MRGERRREIGGVADGRWGREVGKWEMWCLGGEVEAMDLEEEVENESDGDLGVLM